MGETVESDEGEGKSLTREDPVESPIDLSFDTCRGYGLWIPIGPGNEEAEIDAIEALTALTQGAQSLCKNEIKSQPCAAGTDQRPTVSVENIPANDGSAKKSNGDMPTAGAIN